MSMCLEWYDFFLSADQTRQVPRPVRFPDPSGFQNLTGLRSLPGAFGSAQAPTCFKSKTGVGSFGSAQAPSGFR